MKTLMLCILAIASVICIASCMDDTFHYVKRQIVPLPRVGRRDFQSYPFKRQGIIPGPRVGRSYWAFDDDMHGMDRLNQASNQQDSMSANSMVRHTVMLEDEDSYNEHPIELIPLYNKWDKKAAFTPRIGRSSRFTPRIGRSWFEDISSRGPKTEFTPRIGRSNMIDDKS